MTKPDAGWEDELRAALRAQVHDITAVPPWRQPTGAGRRVPQARCWVPLTAAAAVLLVVASIFITRTTIDSPPAHPSTTQPVPPPPALATTSRGSTVGPPPRTAAPARPAPSSSSPSMPVNTPTRTGPGATPTPSCGRTQLTLAYRGGGSGSGSDFGVLNIVNRSATACRLSGVLTLTPLDASGAPLAVRPGWRSRVTAPGLVLAAREHLPAPGSASAGGHWAQLVFGGDPRHDPAGPNGSCPLSKVVAPQLWRVSGAVEATVVNSDPHAMPQHHRLTACNDSEGLQLGNVSYLNQP